MKMKDSTYFITPCILLHNFNKFLTGGIIDYKRSDYPQNRFFTLHSILLGFTEPSVIIRAASRGIFGTFSRGRSLKLASRVRAYVIFQKLTVVHAGITAESRRDYMLSCTG